MVDINYPCTGSAERQFDKGEPGNGVVIDINYWGNGSTCSLKLTKLIGKFVGGVG